MSSMLTRAAEKFDALKLSERRLASIAAVVVVAALIYALGVAPSENASRTLERELQTAQAQRDAQALQLDQLRASLTQDPDAQAKAELTALREQAATLDGELALMQPDLVSPQQMLELVRALVARHDGRELVALRALPPEAVSFEPSSAAPRTPEPPEVVGRRPVPTPTPMFATAVPTAVPTLYRHAVELELRADYNAVLGYLGEIETLPARLHVDSLQIVSERWPRLHVLLRIETLSLREGWAGV